MAKNFEKVYFKYVIKFKYVFGGKVPHYKKIYIFYRQ